MQSAETVLDVIGKRGERGLPIERLYRQMFNPQLFLVAYGRLYSNAGAMTPGVTGETVDGMSLAKIAAIIDALRGERTALYIEESLYRGTQWVVFEPNDEPLWAQIRLNVGAFMHNLFRQGAFQGTTPKDAYFVKCDKETTTQTDIDNGIVNIIVGFAPLKPAEFVVIKLQQMAGQVAA
jgi:tail sheath protein